MKKILIVLFLTLFIANESNAFRPKQFIASCELKDGIFESSFTNFAKKDIKRFKNKSLSIRIDSISKNIMSNNDGLSILHGILENEKLINYELFMKKKFGEKSWDKTFKKYEYMHTNDLYWLSELVIQEEPLVKYKYEGKICLICKNEDFLKIEIFEYSGLKIPLGINLSDTAEVKKKKYDTAKEVIVAKNSQNPYTLTPSCKWKPIPN